MKTIKEISQNRMFWSIPLVLLAGSLSQPAEASVADQLFGRRAKLNLYNNVEFQTVQDCRQENSEGVIIDTCGSGNNNNRERKTKTNYHMMSGHSLHFRSGLAEVNDTLSFGFDLAGSAMLDLARNDSFPRHSAGYNPGYKLRQRDCRIEDGKKICYDSTGWARLSTAMVKARVEPKRSQRLDLAAGVGMHGAATNMLKRGDYRKDIDPKTYRGISGNGRYEDYRYSFAVVDRYMEGQMGSPHKLFIGGYNNNNGMMDIPYYATFGIRRSFSGRNRLDLQVGHHADFQTTYLMRGFRSIEWGDSEVRIIPSVEVARMGGKRWDEATSRRLEREEQDLAEYYNLKFFHESKYSRNVLTFTYAGGNRTYRPAQAGIHTQVQGFRYDVSQHNARAPGTRSIIFGNRLFLTQDFWPEYMNNWYVRLDYSHAWYNRNTKLYRNDADHYVGQKEFDASNYTAGFGYAAGNESNWAGNIRLQYGYDHTDYYSDTGEWYDVVSDRTTRLVASVAYNIRSGRYAGTRFRLQMNLRRQGRVKAGYLEMDQKDLDSRNISLTMRIPVSIL